MPATLRDLLQHHVTALAGPRHPRTAPAALARAADYIEQALAATGLPVERRAVRFRGEDFSNIVATLGRRSPEEPRLLIGAHYDTAPHTPGADDNASGIAALIEVARLLAAARCEATVEFAGFTLEEFQGSNYGIGSRAFAEAARRDGTGYIGALILEMVGYADARPGSQVVPPGVGRKRIPREGTFLAAAGDRRSGALLEAVAHAAKAAAPPLPLVTLKVPFRGWLHPYTRLSDNRSFWDAGYPALMLTDTAFLRNPHYHKASDRAETLDYDFMARVTEVVVAAARRLARP